MTHASSSANQSKAEPFPASATEGETETPGGAAPTDPVGPRAEQGQGDPATVPQPGTEPSPGTSEELPRVQGLHVPDVAETDPRD